MPLMSSLPLRSISTWSTTRPATLSCHPNARMAYESSVATSLTLRIVTFGALTQIEPVTSLFSYTWPGVDRVTEPLTGVSCVPGVTPVFSTSGNPQTDGSAMQLLPPVGGGLVTSTVHVREAGDA